MYTKKPIMQLATKADKNHIIQIIAEAYDKNPHVNYVIKNDSKRQKRLRTIANYAFEVGFRRQGVFLTDNKQGITIIFPSSRAKTGIYEVLLMLDVAINACTLPRVWQVNQFENLVKSKRPKDLPYLYLWFFGVSKEALGTPTARQLMKFVFQQSDEQQLPIYIETSLFRNTNIYARYGFETYGQVVVNPDLTVWCMKRTPQL